MQELTLGTEDLVGKSSDQIIVDEVETLEELDDISSDLENDELVPTDDDDVEDLVDQSTETVQPQLKPINANELAVLLNHVKSKSIGFKFGEVYFEIKEVDLRKGTFTASPANKIIGAFKPPPVPKLKMSQQAKKQRRKKR